MKLVWREGDRKGPAIMVFSADGDQFFGLWWHEGSEHAPGSIWDGQRKAKAVGTCPHWSGDARVQMAKDLEQFGRVRVYGINFDIDSATIKDESKPLLDRIVALLKADPGLSLTIEGHTDASGSATRNATLRGQRAESVKAYLVAAGVAATRLKTAGRGSSKTVASNKEPLGRAQNRRVELVKN